MSKHTPGPFRFVQQASWPYSLSLYAGAVPLISVPLPAHSSADKTVSDAISAVNFSKDERDHAAGMNAEMIANFRLWAAAPALLDACIAVNKCGNAGAKLSRAASDKVRAAIREAEGSS